MVTRECTTPNGIPYHAGDEMDWNTGKGEPLLIHIDRIDDESLFNKVADICDSRLVEKMTPAGQTIATGFPLIRWPSYMKKLWGKGNNVYLAGENADGTHREVKHRYGRDYLPIHAIVHLDDREYRIEQVDFQQETVTLRDLSEKSDARFPLIRQESTETVYERLEEEPFLQFSEETRKENWMTA